MHVSSNKIHFFVILCKWRFINIEICSPRPWKLWWTTTTNTHLPYLTCDIKPRVNTLILGSTDWEIIYWINLYFRWTFSMTLSNRPVIAKWKNVIIFWRTSVVIDRLFVLMRHNTYSQFFIINITYLHSIAVSFHTFSGFCLKSRKYDTNWCLKLSY